MYSPNPNPNSTARGSELCTTVPIICRRMRLRSIDNRTEEIASGSLLGVKNRGGIVASEMRPFVVDTSLHLHWVASTAWKP